MEGEKFAGDAAPASSSVSGGETTPPNPGPSSPDLKRKRVAVENVEDICAEEIRRLDEEIDRSKRREASLREVSRELQKVTILEAQVAALEKELAETKAELEESKEENRVLKMRIARGVDQLDNLLEGKGAKEEPEDEGPQS